MKVVLLAGGFGTRISEESHLRPKPMIEIGGAPILWHIMKYYSSFGYNDFVICCGYKGYVIKEYFSDYFLHRSDVTFDFTNGKNDITIHNNVSEAWKVTLVDTGFETMTGGRLKRVEQYVKGQTFMLSYGDGVSDVNLKELVSFHKNQKATITLTAIQPGGRFGVLGIENNRINSFTEKRKEDGGWINGGFMVVGPEIFKYLLDDNTVLEQEPLEKLAIENNLAAYKHNGFWQCMDSLKDKLYLEKLIKKNEAPWIVWK